MEAIGNDSRKGTIPRFRLALLALCAIEVTLAIVVPEGLQTRAARAVVEESIRYPAADLAIMGDSVAATGIDQNVLAAGLSRQNLSVGNYSIAGSSPLYSETQFSRMLAAGCKPRAILYVRHPATLGAPMVDRYLGRFASPQEIARAVLGTVPFPDALMGLGCKLSYTLRYREEIRAAMLDGDPGFFTSLNRPPKQWDPPVQNVPMPPVPEEPLITPDFSQNLGPKLSRPITINPTVDKALRRFLAQAKRESVPVYWWMLPTCASLAELPGREAGVARLDAYLEELAREGLIIRLNRLQLVWPDRFFHDPWHLDRYGAALNSRVMVEALEKKLPPVPGSSGPAR